MGKIYHSAGAKEQEIPSAKMVWTSSRVMHSSSQFGNLSLFSHSLQGLFIR